jgi:hypothetical protein
MQALVNIDSLHVLPGGVSSAMLDLRIFGGDEDLVYSSPGVRLGLGKGWEGLLRGSFAGSNSFSLPGGGAIRHGGSDVELAVRYALSSQRATDGFSRRGVLTALLGVSLPSTPAQGDMNIALGASAGFPVGHGAAFYLNPRVTFIEDNTLFGFGAGASVPLGGRVSLVGDYTPLLSGDNTRDTTTGALKRRDLYGAAIRFQSADERIVVDVGYTNTLGATTGFSLTPGLGGSAAFYLSIRARR